MGANTAPIFTGSPKLGRAVWTASSTANVKSDGAGTIGTDIVVLMTSGNNGSFLNRVRLSPAATAASTATTASVHRLFLSTQASGSTTSANTTLIVEVAVAAQSADAPTASTYFTEIPLGFYIPTGYSLLWSMHAAAAASTLWHGVAFYGDY
jgi:hypothetical protein